MKTTYFYSAISYPSENRWHGLFETEFNPHLALQALEKHMEKTMGGDIAFIAFNEI